MSAETVVQPARALASRQMAGAAVLAGVLAFALLAPLLTGDPLSQDLTRVLEAPNVAAPLGTDHLGRNMLARVAHAARLSLALAALTVVSAALPGTLLGIAAAWRGGWLERVLVGVADGVLALPALLLVALLTAAAPGSLWPYYLGLSLAFWVEYFRVVRATSRSLLASPHVEASRLLGFGPAYILKRHLLPELTPMLLTLMTFGAATAVLSLATMGFVGVGLKPPTPELGVMMIEVLPYYQEAPWLLGAPVLLLVTVVMALALLRKDEATS
jgi:peptide/nickel transport system permease protein